MRKLQVLLLMTIGLTAVSCQKSVKNTESERSSEDNKTQLPAYTYTGETPYLAAVCQYLTDSVAKNYVQGEVCIPAIMVVHVDGSNASDTKVWGDFWVLNYILAGDTLKTVSGGSHPGLIHLRQNGNGYEVFAFEKVGDGSRHIPSAKRIFGEYFPDYQRISSNEVERERVREAMVVEYVKANQLPISYYQDYGWDAVSLTR